MYETNISQLCDARDVICAECIKQLNNQAQNAKCHSCKVQKIMNNAFNNEKENDENE